MPRVASARDGSRTVVTRALHLDLKGVPPTPRRLISLLDVIKAAGYNALLVEWEDMFPWTVDEGLRCETCYTPAEVKRFHREAAGRALEVIPLVQCLGHMETPLSLPRYARLRSVAYRSDGLNPLAPGARRLVEEMIDDVLSLSPGVSRFHIGGDEARTLGRSREEVAYLGRHAKAALYLQHVEPILDGLRARGIRPIVWSDMMHRWSDHEVRRIAARADLCPWGYNGHPDTWQHHSAQRHIQRFHDNGATLWGATGYKGATDPDADLCDFAQQEENALGWRDVAARFGMVGLIATAWSRHQSHLTQTEPIDGSLDSLVNVGFILRDGKAPGRERCIEALGEMGEGERFEACRTALGELARLRCRAWREVKRLRQQVVLETADVRRRAAGMAAASYIDLRQCVELDAPRAAAAVRRAFRGLMQPLWIERYLLERVGPLLEELASLEPRVRLLEPAAWAAARRLRRWNP